MSRLRGFLRWLLVVVLVAGAMELSAALALRVVNARVAMPILRRSDLYARQTEGILALIEAHEAGGRVLFDAHLGHRYRPGYRAPGRSVNDQGVRAPADYGPVAPAGILRVAAFGDSFVFGTEVDDAEAWPHLLESADSRLEVLNYGVGAYGMAQAYLRFVREGRRLDPSVVLIGFTPVMMRRTTNRYRPFLGTTYNPLVKPRYRLVGGDLELLRQPISDLPAYRRYLDDPDRIVELAAHDAAYRPSIYENPLYDLSATVRFVSGALVKLDNRYLRNRRPLAGGVYDRESEAFRVQVALQEAFAREVRDAGMTPIVVVLPDDESIARDRAGRRIVYEPLLAALDARGIAYIDLLEAFREARPPPPLEEWFMPGRHYSAAANRVVAAWLDRELGERFVRSPGPDGTRTRWLPPAGAGSSR